MRWFLSFFLSMILFLFLGKAVQADDVLRIDYSGVNLPWDIGEKIRAMEDPGYSEYLKRKARIEYETERKAAWMRAERQRKKIRRERLRKKQVQWRKKQVRRDHSAEYEKKHQERIEAYRKKQLELAKEHDKMRRKKEIKRYKEQLAILKKLKQSRMPASTPPERVDRRRRRF